MDTFRSSILFLGLTALIFTIGCQSAEPEANADEPGPVKVELKQTGDNYQVYVEGEPFWINGAGLEFGNVEALAEHGGNSFRTWRTDNGQSTGQEVLDRAHKNGVFVTMGIEVGRERHGFDYNDEAAVQEQFERIKKEVMMYKDHPALIIWGIGNELNLRATNPKVWDAVNQISEFIHEVDPNHLTTTSLAGISKDLVDEIKVRATDLDLLSIQMYGDIENLPLRIEESGWDGPFMITEWGATGHWEVDTTAWGAPVENHSSVKAKSYLDRFQNYIEPLRNQCVGSYVFLWGQKQERTPTWYGMFLESGEETETVDVMHYLWNDSWPDNRSPLLEAFLLDGKTAYQSVTLEAGATYETVATITDPDGDPIEFRWEVKPESTSTADGGDPEYVPETIPGLLEGDGATVSLTAPTKPGAYRLFVYGLDGHNNAAHANIPFYVEE
jgi:hypothetical protein